MDYEQLGLSTGRHPLALLRPKLEYQGALTGEAIRGTADGSIVTVVGMVTHVQRPQTAKNVVFISLEDETGIINLVIWPTVFDKYRPAILKANLLRVRGKLQNVENVVHVIAQHIDDYSEWTGNMERRSRDFR